MTKKQCWRYKCDHCGKVMYSSQWMKRHEEGCTANPARTCRMPIHEGEQGQQPIETLKELREISDECPACILAAIRQTGIQKVTIDEDGVSGIDLKFNFKEELAAMWHNINECSGPEGPNY
jgi:hypothetical protein